MPMDANEIERLIRAGMAQVLRLTPLGAQAGLRYI